MWRNSWKIYVAAAAMFHDDAVMFHGKLCSIDI